MQFQRKKKDKNKQKSHKSLFESLSKNTWKHMELKYLDQLYSTANDPQPQMIPRPQMIPKMDRKWSSTASDP